MPRKKRQYLPGTAFHITARIQAKAQHFDEPVRYEIVSAISDSLYKTDARLIALTVMPNHLHLVIRQGLLPLASLMQPLLTRAALRTKRAKGLKDHVFGGRFFSKPCLNPQYLREVILYTHLNPVRWGLCKHPEDYAWSTAAMYATVGCETVCGAQFPLIGLNLFAGYRTETYEQIVFSYRQFCDWRQLCDTAPTGADLSGFAPNFSGGNDYWIESFSGISQLARAGDAPDTDLRDIAQSILARRLPGMTLDDFLFSGGKYVMSVRREIIGQAIRAGFNGITIARFLRVSEATISRFRCVKNPALTG